MTVEPFGDPTEGSDPGVQAIIGYTTLTVLFMVARGPVVLLPHPVHQELVEREPA